MVIGKFANCSAKIDLVVSFCRGGPKQNGGLCCNHSPWAKEAIKPTLSALTGDKSNSFAIVTQKGNRNWGPYFSVCKLFWCGSKAAMKKNLRRVPYYRVMVEKKNAQGDDCLTSTAHVTGTMKYVTQVCCLSFPPCFHSRVVLCILFIPLPGYLYFLEVRSYFIGKDLSFTP